MNWITRLFSRKRIYNELSDEMQQHLAEKIDELVAGGMSREDAAYAARREFGNATLLEEQGRQVWRWQTVESVLFDIRYALRQLRRNPGYTFAVLATLALAIGVNSAAFAMVNALLLRPLPYPEPERLGSAMWHVNTPSVTREVPRVDGETWELVRDNVPSVIAAAYQPGHSGVNLQAGASGRYVYEQRVSARYFEVLGISPAIGRLFNEDEDRPAGPKVALLSYDLWKSAFNLDPQITGKTVLLKGEPYQVLGVMPSGTKALVTADVWTPLRPGRGGEGGGTNYSVAMRLKNDATWVQANTEIARLRPHFFLQFSRSARTWLYAFPLQRQLAIRARGPALMLMLAVCFILLLACANLAGVLMVRVSKRTPEITTRMALGASRIAVVRTVLSEPLVLSLLGGAMGLALAMTSFKFIETLIPKYMVPLGGFGLDARVLLFTLAASLFTGLVVGMLPALQIRKLNLYGSMAGQRSATTKQRVRQIFIAGQVTLTVVLLAGAGLLVRTLAYLETLPSGFDPTNVMAAQLSLDDARYRDKAAFLRLVEQSLTSMKLIPGVESAAVGLALPYERALNDGITIADGAQKGQQNITNAVYVTPDYFHVLRIPVLAGRAFSDSDTADSQQVAIVNMAFVRSQLGGSDPVGRHLQFGPNLVTIVGVVADVIKPPGISDLSAPLTTEATVYVPPTQMNQRGLTQVHVWFQPSWLVRTNRPINGLPAAMQKTLAETDANLPFSGFHSMNDLQAEALAYQRLEVTLLSALAGLALLLTLVGIYSLVSNLVVQRTREIGIRMALGSTTGEAMMEIGKSGVIAVAYGLVAGLVLSALVVGFIKSELYGVQPFDPITLIAVLALLALAAIAASFLPTLRISRIDPALTLRAE